MSSNQNRSSAGFLKRTARECSTFLLFLLAVGVSPAAGQSTGTIAPVGVHQFFDNSGNPCDSCKLYTYTTGTTTPLATYTDAALSVAHPNPIVMNSAGRPAGGSIYLSAATYKFVLKTSADATLWTADGIAAVPATTIAAAFNSTCDGRLSLTSGTSITTSDVTAATTVYWVPSRGNRCALYDGASSWSIVSFTELSIALGSDAADTNYDVFLYTSSGTPTLERVAWSGSGAGTSSRAVALTLQDGVLVKSTDTTKRYVGTYRTTTTIGQTEDSVTKRFVWNLFNRVPRALKVTDATDQWNYTTATIRQARASTANQVAVVVGIVDAPIVLNLRAVAQNTNTGVNVAVGVGANSTTTFHANCLGLFGQTQVANLAVSVTAQCDIVPSAVGYHFYSWNEVSAATGTTTWSGDAGLTTMVSGLSGVVVQ